MYLEDGVEMYSVTPVQVQPAAISVIAAPWGTSFTDSAAYLPTGSWRPGIRFSGGPDLPYGDPSIRWQVGISLSTGEVSDGPDTFGVLVPYGESQLQQADHRHHRGWRDHSGGKHHRFFRGRDDKRCEGGFRWDGGFLCSGRKPMASLPRSTE